MHVPQEPSVIETPPQGAQKAAVGDYLAAERTLLAWIRTGLALMGFGFVVARFGLFLEQLQTIRGAPTTEHTGVSLWFGTALIAVGVLVSVIAGVHHMRLVRRLDRGDTGRPHRATEAVVIAFLLALVGLGMAAYLISVRSSTRSQPGNSKETSMTTAPKAESSILPVVIRSMRPLRRFATFLQQRASPFSRSSIIAAKPRKLG